MQPRYRHTAFALLAIASFSALAAPATDKKMLERGRYIIAISGCNDCHTPGFTQSGGKVPEAQWLTGDRLGWQGPWGTTYAPNLRTKLNAMSEAQWIKHARELQARPPMPSWSLHLMSDADVKSIWHFVKALGPAGDEAPAYAPPGTAVNGPVVRFP